jgi:tagatose 1,6-diphosphate aldolase GatY/KbaY
VRQAYVSNLAQSLQNPALKDLLVVMQSGVDAMQAVITDKLELFGSIHKQHLHQSPYADMLPASTV